jgi:hypothetical protein
MKLSLTAIHRHAYSIEKILLIDHSNDAVGEDAESGGILRLFLYIFHFIFYNEEGLLWNQQLLWIPYGY